MNPVIADKKLTTLSKEELIELVINIYIDYQLQCDDPTEYEIMTEYIEELIKTDNKYNKENLEIIIQLSK